MAYTTSQAVEALNEFKGLSAEAIILYSMLLKRTGMSFKNNWIDKEGFWLI